MIFKIIQIIDVLIERLQGIGGGAVSIKKEVACIKKIIPNGKIFIDVGANKGYYTNELLKSFDAQEIHVFEPSELNFQILSHSYLNNDKIFLNKKGLSNTNFESILYSSESGSALASLSKRRLDHFNIFFNNQEKIDLHKFEDYWTKNGQNQIIDLFKIDVEGHELMVLQGIGTYLNKIKVIQFEFGGCNIDSRTFFQDYWYFFQENKFKIYRITPLGYFEIKKYRESYERFKMTNYICINQNLF